METNRQKFYKTVTKLSPFQNSKKDRSSQENEPKRVELNEYNLQETESEKRPEQNYSPTQARIHFYIIIFYTY